MSSLADFPELVGFFSYSRDDDKAFRRSLSTLREAVGSELAARLGRSEKNFRLWQDQEAIAWGDLWESEITKAIEQSAFFIPIITPRAVASKNCKFEFDFFLARQSALGRDDLVFPIFICPFRTWRRSRNGATIRCCRSSESANIRTGKVFAIYPVGRGSLKRQSISFVGRSLQSCASLGSRRRNAAVWRRKRGGARRKRSALGKKLRPRGRPTRRRRSDDERKRTRDVDRPVSWAGRSRLSDKKARQKRDRTTRSDVVKMPKRRCGPRTRKECQSRSKGRR